VGGRKRDRYGEGADPCRLFLQSIRQRTGASIDDFYFVEEGVGAQGAMSDLLKQIFSVLRDVFRLDNTASHTCMGREIPPPPPPIYY
jgi:hypothetical protein